MCTISTLYQYLTDGLEQIHLKQRPKHYFCDVSIIHNLLLLSFYFVILKYVYTICNNMTLTMLLHDYVRLTVFSINYSVMIYAQDENPNMQLWCSFLEMTGILQRFLCAQREGDWLDFLSEAGNMLPYIISAGHHKYGVFLPLYLKEMKDL